MTYGRHLLWLCISTVLAVGLYYALTAVDASLIFAVSSTFVGFVIWAELFVAVSLAGLVLVQARIPHAVWVGAIAGILAYPISYFLTPMFVSISFALWIVGTFVSVLIAYIAADFGVGLLRKNSNATSEK